MTENNLELLRCEKFVIFHFMALSTCDQFLYVFGKYCSVLPLWSMVTFV